jgi:hypothetical protein
MAALPFSTDDSVGVGGTTTLDLTGADDDEVLKRIDSTTMGGSGISAVQASGANFSNTITLSSNGNNLSRTVHAYNSGSNYFNMQIKPDSSNASAFGINVRSDAATDDTHVGINIPEAEEALDIEGNIQLRGSAAGKIKFRHSTGVQKVELDYDVDGTNGGEFIVQTKEDGGGMNNVFKVNNKGAIGVGKGLLNNFGNPGSVLMSIGNTSAPEWFVFNPKIICAAEKTTSQTFASGAAATGVIGFQAAHVNTGGGTFDTVSGAYNVARTGTYRINARITVSNTGNDHNELRFLQGTILISDFLGSTLLSETSTTMLVNVSSTAGSVDRSTVTIEEVRGINTTDKISLRIAALDSVGNFVVESAQINIEEIGGLYATGTGTYLSLTGGTLSGTLTAPGFIPSGLPLDSTFIGHRIAVAVPSLTVVQSPGVTIMAQVFITAGVWMITGAVTMQTPPNTNYGYAIWLDDAAVTLELMHDDVLSATFSSQRVTTVYSTATNRTITLNANINQAITATSQGGVNSLYAVRVG